MLALQPWMRDKEPGFVSSFGGPLVDGSPEQNSNRQSGTLFAFLSTAYVDSTTKVAWRSLARHSGIRVSDLRRLMYSVLVTWGA
jgi:hypothetical protein